MKLRKCHYKSLWINIIIKLKEIYGRKSPIIVERQQRLKEKIDDIIRNEKWEVDDIFQSEHDYSLSSALDCIIYYVTGYFFFFRFIQKSVSQWIHNYPSQFEKNFELCLMQID